MRSKTKRILALLCAVVLVATTFLGNTYMKQSEVKAADSVEPISLDGFENVTISDFSKDGVQMPETTHQGPAESGTLTTYALTSGESLNKKLLSMNVTFAGGGGNARLDVAGTGDWTGFSVYASDNNHYLHIYTNYNVASPAQGFDIDLSKAGFTTSVVGTEILLQMSLEFVDTTLNVGAYVNGVLCGTYAITGCDLTKFGNCLGLYVEGNDRAITARSVEWPPEPIWLDGFTNVTIKNFAGLTSGTTYEGVSTGFHKDCAALTVTDFDNVLLSMKVTLTAGTYKTRLDIGGNAGWTGFSLQANDDGSKFQMGNNYGMTTTVDLPSLEASVAGVDSFLNNPFLLQMSFEYGEVVNNRADVVIGMYINGKLYNDQKFTIADCNMEKMGNHLAFYSEVAGGNATFENVIAPVEPAFLDDFGNLTISNFVNDAGQKLVTGAYPGSSGGAHGDYYVSGLTNFDRKLVSLNVTFEGGSYMNSIIIGGNGGWSGFNIHPNDQGTQLVIDKTWAQNHNDLGSYSPHTIDATTAGLNSFIDNEFLLQISFAYGEAVDGYSVLTMGVYIDGNLYNNFTIAGCSTSTWGTHMALYRQVDGQSMIIGNEIVFPKFAGYTEVTVEDFVDDSGNVMEEKAYMATMKGAYDTFSLKEYDNFDKKKVTFNVMFKHGGGNTRIDIAGASAWNGVSMFANKEGTYLFVSSNYGGVSSGSPKFPIEIHKDSVGITSFLDTKFLLEMTFRYVSDTQIEVGIYVNGVLANDQKYTLTVSDMAKFGDYIGFYREDDESTILIGSVNSDTFPVDMGIQPSYRYEKLTFGHFGIVNKKYPYVAGDVAVQGPANGRTTLDKTVIMGSIFLEGSNNSQIIWGGNSGWNGLRMFPNSGGTMQLTWYNGGTATPIVTLNSETAGVAFVGEKYDIMLSSELVDNDGDGEVNDIKVGIWFNGTLYNQTYIIVPNLGNEYGNYFSVYCATETDTVTLGSVMDLLEQPSESLKKITFFQYEVEDGTYESAADINTKGNYIKGDTVAGTVLCGDIQLINSSAGEIDIFLGSTDNVWTQGIRLTKYGGSTDFKLIYQTADSYKEVLTIKPSAAGVDFDNEKFNLMWSMEMVDSDEDGTADDLKVGLWFNGFLYQQTYTYITDFGVDMLGDTFATYCASGTAITLNSIYELTQLPDKSFDKITFSDFGLESQKITCGADVVASSRASAYSTFDRVVFSGDFRFSDTGDYQIIYGGDSGWSGLRLMIDSSGNLNGSWYKGNESQLVIWGTPTHLGLNSLTQETVNVMISTELVDDDGDGNKNDIKVGVWFNKVLYEFEGSGYHIVKDWGDQLLNGFSIYGAGGSSTSVMIRNDADYQSNPSYFEDIAEYRATTKTAPDAPEGYVFAGWYADADYTEFIGTDVTSGKAWAKFVEEDVLTIKPQVRVNDDGSVPTDKTDIRFVTTVDNLEYRKISFKISKYDNEKGAYKSEKDAASFTNFDPRLVYEKLYAVGSDSKTMTYMPSIFSWQSEYFKAFTVKGIPYADGGYDTMIKVTPYWVTMDGTTVSGKVLETCVSKYNPGTNSSTAVSYDFLGEETMPITGYFGPYPVSNATDTNLFPDYNTDEYFKMIADSGVNLMVYSHTDYSTYPNLVKKQLQMGEKYGVGIYVYDKGIYNKSEADMLAQMSQYSNYKAFCGMYLVDEPGTSSYLSGSDNGLATDFSDEATILNNNNFMFYGNMYPIVDADSNVWEDLWSSSNITNTDKTAYGKYINEFYTALNPKVLSYDYYPFDDSRIVDGKYDLALYFYNMAAIRNKAQSTNKPFWAFVQAGGQWNDKSEYFTSTTPYYPDQGQFDWIVNTSLAFGAQGIQYFPLVQPQHFAYGSDATHWDFERNGIIGAFGNKTQWYYYAQEINEHIATIDSVLMKSSSEQIIALGSDAKSATSGLTDVTTSTSYNNVLTSATASGNALIGCFNYCGKTAFYVVNYDYDNPGTVTLNFNGTKSITQIDNAVTTETSASSMTLSMEAGEGILLVIE